MKLEKITEGLKQLLLENNYNPVTIHFYEREWKKIPVLISPQNTVILSMKWNEDLNILKNSIT